VNKKIRVRFYTWGNPDLYVDSIGIGGVEPGAPSLNAPSQTDFVTVLRPTLVVNNAAHAENKPLTYRFEVYADSTLLNLVAQVPAVASGADTTAWTVDINLNDNALYWWRCRASYGVDTGPWMPVAIFTINVGGTPPSPPVLAVPVDSTVRRDTNSLLAWYPSTDADPGDFIRAYQVQVDDEADFSSPFIDETLLTDQQLSALPSSWLLAVPLGRLAGSANLMPGTVYYWRVRAQDAHYHNSAWSQGPRRFAFAYFQPAIPANLLVRRVLGQGFLLQWTGPTNNTYVEFTPTLTPPAWTTIAGPLSGSEHILSPPTNTANGFYRLRSE
jgi:hypothetical protein